MDCYKITLPFPPSVNGLFGGGSQQKRFPSKQYKAWLSGLPRLAPLNISNPCHIHYKFYWPDNRIRDGQSYFKATTDYLVKQKVIVDDNWKILASESWSHGGVDKQNPRVDITIMQTLDLDQVLLNPCAQQNA
jgi:Holliday junction resolvase RusA-like endonuclease